MTAKVSFENHYEDYSPNSDTDSITILNHSYGISEEFNVKLQSFTSSKLSLLTSEMESDIFHDSTVYTGSAGMAMYYLRTSLETNDHKKLKAALEYINLNHLKGRRISFLCGDAGPLALATVISFKLGSKGPETLPDYKTLALRLMSLISLLNDSPDEILYGKAGYLYALLFVNKHITGKQVIPTEHIEKVIDAILWSGKQFSLKEKSSSPLLWQWHEKIYFGAAHGMAGILYMLLQARTYINITEIRSFIKPTLDWLISHQFPSGNFPSSMASSSGDKLVQWCHGAPGFVSLCILSSKVFEEDRYMKIAFRLGDTIWDRGLCTKGYSICHGVSGNAYTFLQLYQATKNPKYLYRAGRFMEWCVVEKQGTELHRPDRPASLFEGLLGRLYLAEELRHPMDAKFPGMSV